MVTRYHFTVSAAGSDTGSRQCSVYPFLGVGKAGELTGGPVYPWRVSSSGPARDMAALPGISDVIGTLTLKDVGSKGYAIFNTGGARDSPREWTQ